MRNEAEDYADRDERDASPLIIVGLFIGSLVLILAIVMSNALAAVPPADPGKATDAAAVTRHEKTIDATRGAEIARDVRDVRDFPGRVRQR